MARTRGNLDGLARLWLLRTKMVYLQPNSKMNLSFSQGNIGSQVPVDIGSCTLVYGYNSYSGLDFSFSQNAQNLPFQVDIERPKNERIAVCGSLAVEVSEGGSKVGYITFEVLHDLQGPNGISQVSPQIIVRDVSGKPLAQPYKPKELHNFDLNNGEILSTIKINDEELYKQKIKKQPPT